jgi:ubiquitin C-terminal hydrolase
MGVSIRPSASSAHALAPPVRPPHPSTDAPAAEAELGVRARRSLLDAWEAYERMEPVGLPNVGNSCYMNAALQCLLAIPQLTAYFLSGAWRDELNAANPLGSGGAVAEALARLVSDLWPAEALALEDGAVRAARTPRAAALAFKTRLEAHRADFRGARQHDAHEFGALLLDSLHEDLSRCAGPRAYVVDVECHEAAAEARTAAASWGHYLRRDRSVVVDLFQGQLRSQVRCHECAHASTRFDPTMLLSLPLPPKEPGEGGCAAAAAILFGRRRAAPTASPLSDAPAAAPSLGRDEAADGGGARSALDLADCFAELFKAEELGADNLWSCPHCKAFRSARAPPAPSRRLRARASAAACLRLCPPVRARARSRRAHLLARAPFHRPHLLLACVAPRRSACRCTARLQS